MQELISIISEIENLRLVNYGKWQTLIVAGDRNHQFFQDKSRSKISNDHHRAQYTGGFHGGYICLDEEETIKLAITIPFINMLSNYNLIGCCFIKGLFPYTGDNFKNKTIMALMSGLQLMMASMSIALVVMAFRYPFSV